MSLDKEKIAHAALDLLDEVGLDDFTTRKLGAALEISGPSLYWHFRNKGEILDMMGERLLADCLPPPDFKSEPFDWIAWLSEGALGVRAGVLARRDGARLVARLSGGSPRYMAELNANVRCLQRIGVSEEEALSTLMCLGRYAIGWALHEQMSDDTELKRRMVDGFEFGLEIFLEGLKAKFGVASPARTRELKVAGG